MALIRDNYFERQIFEIIFYLFLGGFVLFASVFGGFSLRGFAESFETGLIGISGYLGTLLIYMPLMIIAFVLIIFPIMNLLFIKKGDHPATQDNPGWLRIFTVSYIFNPEDGALWQLGKLLKEKNIMRWSTNILRVLAISILFFGFMGILSLSYPQLNVVGVPQAQLQQITVASDVIFNSAIPSFSENGTLAFLLFFLLGINAYICAKFFKEKGTRMMVFFIIALLLIAPFVGLVWMSFHSIVYGSSAVSLQATFIFGWLGSTITILTGIFLFWFIWHFMNNFFVKLSELIILKEDIFLISIIIWVIFLISYVSVEILLAKRKKRGKETELTR